MNRIYKVIWNQALGCFTAVGEYAKGRGKSSKSSVGSNTNIHTTSNLFSINTLRLSAIGLGLLAAGFGMQTNATGTYFTGDDSTPKVYISPYGTLKVQGGETVTGDYRTKNISVTADKWSNSLTIKLDKNIDLGVDGSLKTGDTLVDSSGIKITANNPINNVKLTSHGLNNGNNKIINVNDGEITATSKDAINGSQLNSLTNTVAANKTKYYSVNSTATGNINNDGATGQNAMAMGGNTTATGGQAIAIGSGQSGQHTTASGQQSIAIGANVVSKGHSSIALGGDDLDDASKANVGNNSVSAALNGGTVNTVFKDYAGKDMVEANQFDVNTESGGAASIAIGVKAQSKGDLSTAVGVHANSAGTASSAFGMAASATKKGALALGAGSQSNAQDGVALGSKSVASVAGGATGFVPVETLSIDENAIIKTKSVALGAVSIGTGEEGGNRQIVNLAAGTSDSDAVNVAQLKGLQNGVNYTLNQGIDFGGDSGTKVNRKLGEKLLVKGGETDATKLTSGNNVGVVSNGTDTLTIKLAKDLTGLNSVTTGNSLLNNDGVSFLGGSSVRLSQSGLNNGGNQITNVASGGTIESNAANIGDLNTAITGVSTLGFALKAADGNTVQKPLGQAVEVVGANDNIDTRVNNGKIEVELNDNLDLGSTGSVKMGSSNPIGLGPVTTINRLGLTTGNTLGSTAVNGLGVFVNGPLGIPSTGLTADGLTILNGPSMTRSGGIDAGNKKITNVKAGVAVDDAVNVSQLTSASAAARTEVGAGTNITDVVKTTGSNGQDIYTVNADGVTASAGSAAVIVTAAAKDTATNMTDYAVDLSDASKASLVKADSALQSVVTQIDGNVVKTLDKDNNNANFLTGDNIVLTAEEGGIKVATAENVSFTSVATGDALLNTDGVSFLGGSTVRLSQSGLNNGGNQITNVADGKDDTDAVNIRQLNATNNTVDLGLDFTGDDISVVVNRKLGQTVTIQGGATTLTENNIGVVADEDGRLNVRLAEDVMLGRAGSVRMENTVLNNAGITITDGPNQTVTLSNEGLDNGNNRIIKVAEGIAPSDAVNYAQLTATNNEVAKGIKIGDGNSDNDQQFALGDTINVTGDSNITTVATATGVQVKLNNQLDLGGEGSIQIGNSIMNNTGFTFVDNGLGTRVMLSSIGLDNGGNPIRNVGKGTLNTDAVNVEQLREVAIALDQGWGLTAQGDIATMIKQGSSVDMNSTDGNIKVSRTITGNTASSINAAAPANGISFNLNPEINVVSVTTGDTTINDNGLTIVGGSSVTKNGIDAANTKITRVQNGDVTADSQEAINGSQLYAQGSGISSIIGGNTVYNAENGTFTNSNIGGTGQGSIDGAIASIRQGTIEINENVQTNTTNIATNTTNIAMNTTNIATNVTNIKANKDRLDAGLNFGADSGTNINKPVGDGSVLKFTGSNNITTTAQGSAIKFDLNGNINLDSVTTGNTIVNNNGITIANGPSMTANGIDAASKKITNVADGMAPRDAVNFGQLDAVSRRLGDSMNELGYKIGEVEDDANAGISAAMAMSSLPQAYIIGKSMIGGGIGTYNGESAVAIGFSKLSNDGRWVMKLNGTADTQGNAGASIGAGFHFD